MRVVYAECMNLFYLVAAMPLYTGLEIFVPFHLLCIFFSFQATKQFLSDLIRGSFANAYGERKEHRWVLVPFMRVIFINLCQKLLYSF